MAVDCELNQCENRVNGPMGRLRAVQTLCNCGRAYRQDDIWTRQSPTKPWAWEVELASLYHKSHFLTQFACCDTHNGCLSALLVLVKPTSSPAESNSDHLCSLLTKTPYESYCLLPARHPSSVALDAAEKRRRNHLQGRVLMKGARGRRCFKFLGHVPFPGAKQHGAWTT